MFIEHRLSVIFEICDIAAGLKATNVAKHGDNTNKPLMLNNVYQMWPNMVAVWLDKQLNFFTYIYFNYFIQRF